MKEESSWGKKFLTLSTSLVLAAGTTVAATSPAHADGLGSIRIVSSTPTIDTTTNGYNNQAAMDGWIGQTWYPAGSTLKQTYVDTGSSFDLTYEVRDSSNALMPSQEIKVAVNKGYSGSAAALTCGSTTVNAAGDGVDGAIITLTTNANGRATLSCDNSDLAASGITRPSSLVASATITGGLHTQIWPYIEGQAGNYAADMQEFWFLTPASVVIPPRTATSTLLTFETADTLGNGAAGLAAVGDSTGSWEGAVSSIDNAPAGGNGGKALKIVKQQVPEVNRAAWWTGSIHPYAGVTLLDSSSSTDRYTNAGNKLVTMNFYSPNAGNTPVQIKLDPNVFACASAPRGWSKLTFDVSTDADWSASTEYKVVSIMPNWKKDCDASYEPFGAGSFVDNDTAYYIDNVALNGATTPAIPAAVTRATVRTASAITGTAKKGRSLTASATFAGSASTKTYQWYRCTVAATSATTALPTSAAKCTVAKAFSTSASYTVSTTDVGKYMRVVVKAHNAAGDTLSLSKTTAKVVK